MNVPFCPRCGGGLVPVAQGPEAAPWLCAPCHLGFYSAELDAVRDFRQDRHDFGPSRGTREAVRIEAEAAHVRGTSLRPEQAPLVRSPDGTR